MNNDFNKVEKTVISVFLIAGLLFMLGCGTENKYYGDCNDLDTGANCSSDDGSYNQDNDDSSVNTDDHSITDNSVDDNSDSSTASNEPVE